MTYIVFARKWRPMKFEDVAGQEHITRTLMNALRQDRMGHAFIFAGPRGIGKTTTARLLAKAVNCENQPTVNPCNECKSCKAITDGHSLDVIEIDGASNRGIDEIRNLRENIRFAPASSKYKVYIIDEVHMLSKEAFNALLKTLEEPPVHAIFIFATTEIHRVPLTILSRCQRFDFKRVATTVIADRLEEIARHENIKIDRESLLLIARKAEGSMRDANSILDQAVSSTDGELSIERIQESLGIINEELYFEFTDLMQQKNDGEIIQFAQRVFLQGHDVMNFMYGLEEHFRHLLIARATGSSKLLETSDYFKKLYEQKAPLHAEKDLLQYLDILTQSESLLKYAENPQLILELILLKLAHKPLAVNLEELLELLKNLPNSPGDADNLQTPPPNPRPDTPSPKSTPTTPESSSKPFKYPDSLTPTKKSKPKNQFDTLKESRVFDAPAVTIEYDGSPEVMAEATVETETADISHPLVELSKVEDKWEQIIAAVKREKIALSSFLQDGVPYKIDGKILEIAFDPKTDFHMNHVQKNAGTIEKIMAEEFQLPLRLKCIKTQFEQKGIKKQIQSPEEIFENMKNKEPVLKKIIELFDCENLEE